MDNTDESAYIEAYRKATSLQTRQQFWKQQATHVQWFQFPKTILDLSNPPFYRWFTDGVININYNMIDRYLPTQANERSLIWVSNMVKQEKIWTLRQVYENICRMCIILREKGVKKGKRVIIYLPMIPQALFTSWACARIGAIHSIVFGGFSAKQLAGRIVDSDPTVIVTASCGIQPHKIVNYVQILNQALNIAKINPTVLIYQRPNYQIECDPSWISFKIQDIEFKHVQCQQMKGTDPLYILYTSGTTGTPKGILRDQGGTTVALQWVMNHIMGINKKDIYFSASDIGWVVGHNYVIYGPLLRGAATVLYQGKPTSPHPGALWQIIEKYKVKGFYTSPTGLRAIRKQDNNGDWIKKYDTSTLQAVSMAGQRCDISTYNWIEQKLGVLINDNYWQTQCGWGISCNYKNLYTFPSKAGSATKPCPGFNVQIISAQTNQKLPIKSLGKVCIKLPLPPSFMLTLYNNDQAFIDKYLSDTPGYYTTGDAGYFDEDGYLNVMTRLDDIINTASHRLSTASMEQQLMKHPKVSQAAVVAKIQQIKGQIPIGFIVLKSGQSEEGMVKQLIALIRKQIGPVAFFQNVLIVQKLPKTKSGKILRHILRKMIQGQQYAFPPTIEDAGVLPKIEEKIKIYGKGLGQKKKLVYRTDIDIKGQDIDMDIIEEDKIEKKKKWMICDQKFYKFQIKSIKLIKIIKLQKTFQNKFYYIFQPQKLKLLINILRNQQSMRLLVHNLLICNVTQCKKNNFPLIIQVQRAIHKQTQFNFNNIKKLIKKLDWPALYKTVLELGQCNFPKIPSQELENQDFLKKLHRIILDTHIISGKLKCPNCRREYPIINGIPNMIIKQNQL